MDLRYVILIKIVKALNVVILRFVILYCWYCRVYNAFGIMLLPVSERIYSQALEILFSDTILYVVTGLISRRVVSIVPIRLCVDHGISTYVIHCVGENQTTVTKDTGEMNFFAEDVAFYSEKRGIIA